MYILLPFFRQKGGLMNIEKIRKLVKLLDESSISELEVHFPFARKVILRKFRSTNQKNLLTTVESTRVIDETESQILNTIAKPDISESEPTGKTILEEEDKYYKITSPMVGTFYRNPSPDSPPYVEIGEKLSLNQVVCLIEAMKLFNEVKTEVSGIVKKVLVEDATPVEFGQVLLLIETE